MCIEFGPVDAGKTTFAAHQHPAPAAHSGAVDHNRIEAHGRRDLVRPRHFGDSLHHWNWANRQHVIDLLFRGDQFFQFLSDEPVLAIAAVVGHHKELVARGPHFVFENQQLL